MPATVIISQTRYTTYTWYDLTAGGELIGSYVQQSGRSDAIYSTPAGGGAAVDGPLDAIVAITHAAGLVGVRCKPGTVTSMRH